MYYRLSRLPRATRFLLAIFPIPLLETITPLQRLADLPA